jgi:hypothetical protein
MKRKKAGRERKRETADAFEDRRQAGMQEDINGNIYR